MSIQFGPGLRRVVITILEKLCAKLVINGVSRLT